MQNKITNLWITLVFLSVGCFSNADSFQCFECENCPTIDGNSRDYIKECEPFEGFSTQAPQSTTTFTGSTKSEGNLTSSSEAAQNSTSSSTSLGLSTNSSSSIGPTTLTLSTLNKTESTSAVTKETSTESTTEKQKVTSIWSMLSKSLEGNESSKPDFEVRNEVGGVCFVLKLKYEGHEITNRGCGLRGQNKDEICQLLGKGEPISECQVCEGNLCNSGSRLKAGVMGFLAVLFLLKANI